MSSWSCSSQLMPFDPNADPETPFVRYNVRSHLLILAGAKFRSEWLEEADWPDTVLAVGATNGTEPPMPNMKRLAARYTSVDGWLGRFKLRAGDSAESAKSLTSPKPDGNFDCIIDCGSPPALTRNVLPFGYFQADDLDSFRKALTACQRLVGSFMKPRYFDYDPTICAHQSFGQTGCTRCLNVCGANAISSDRGQIQVNPYLCQGCGSCTLACPTGALAFRSPDRASLLAQLQDKAASIRSHDATLLVSDTPPSASHSQAAISMVVRPFTAFGDELWLTAFAMGFRHLILLATHGIDPDAERLVRSQMAVTGQVLTSCGLEEQTLVLATTAAEVDKLLGANRGPAHAEAAPVSSITAIDPKRPMLNQTLDALQVAGDDATTQLPPGSALGRIVVDTARCTLCSSCAKLCPTEAINYSEKATPDQAILSFIESRCVQCGICASGCPEDAIELEPRLANLDQRNSEITLSQSPMAACADCGQMLVAEKLLEVTIERLNNHGATDAVVEQARRCPRCRAERLG